MFSLSKMVYVIAILVALVVLVALSIFDFNLFVYFLSVRLFGDRDLSSHYPIIIIYLVSTLGTLCSFFGPFVCT